MQFRTILSAQKQSFSINHRHPLLCMGSCFAQHIGGYLQQRKFATLLNPFGILYNPISIADSINEILIEKQYAEADLFFYNEYWHSWAHHSQFSGADKGVVLEEINAQIVQANAFLKTADYLFLTFGTSVIHQYKQTNEVVANCHKMPAAMFTQKRVSVSAMVTQLQTTIEQLRIFNPKIRILLTVSPVRHIRLGMVENQASKAALLLLCHELCAALDRVHYFPSYELVLDDLRDYRFFESDMLHPNKVAIDYIWDYFSQCFFESETKQLLSKIESIQRASQHRPFHPQSEHHQRFVSQTIQKIKHFVQAYPYLNFEKEKEMLLGGAD